MTSRNSSRRSRGGAPTRRSAHLAGREPGDENTPEGPTVATSPSTAPSRTPLTELPVNQQVPSSSPLTELDPPRDETGANIPAPQGSGPVDMPGTRPSEPPKEPTRSTTPKGISDSEPPRYGELFATTRTSLEEEPEREGSEGTRGRTASISFSPIYFSGNRNDNVPTERPRSASLSRLDKLREREDNEINTRVEEESTEEEVHIYSLEERFRAAGVVARESPIEGQLGEYRDTPNLFWEESTTNPSVEENNEVTLGSVAPLSPMWFRPMETSSSLDVCATRVEIREPEQSDEEVARKKNPKDKKKSKKKIPEFGVIIDEVQAGPSRRKKTPQRKKNNAGDDSRFLAGGYLSMIHGSASKDRKGKGQAIKEPSDDSSSDSDSDSSDSSSPSDSSSDPSHSESSSSSSDSSDNEPEGGPQNEEPEEIEPEGIEPEENPGSEGEPEEPDDDPDEPEEDPSDSSSSESDIDRDRRDRLRRLEKQLKKECKRVKKLEKFGSSADLRTESCLTNLIQNRIRRKP